MLHFLQDSISDRVDTAVKMKRAPRETTLCDENRVLVSETKKQNSTRKVGPSKPSVLTTEFTTAERIKERKLYLQSAQGKLECSLKESRYKLEQQYKHVAKQLEKVYNKELETLKGLAQTQTQKLEKMALDLETFKFQEDTGKVDSRKLTELLTDSVWMNLRYRPPWPLNEENFINFAKDTHYL